MVQLRADSTSSNDQDPRLFSEEIQPSIKQEDLEENKRVDNSNSLSCTATQFQFLAWKSMLERSNDRLDKYCKLYTVRI